MVSEGLKILSGVPEVSWHDVPGTPAAIALMAVAATLLGAAVVRLARAAPGNRLPRRGSRYVLIAILAVATPVGFVLYSLVGSSTVLGRYMLPSLPAIGLLFGAALELLPRRLAPAVVGVAAVALGVGAILSLEDKYERPDYREPAAFIDEEFRAGDLIVDPEIAQFAAGQAFLSRGIAGRDQTYLAVHLDPARRALRVNSLESAVPPTVAGSRIFVVARATALPDPGELPLRLVETRSFPGVRTIATQVYERTPDPGVRARARRSGR